MNCPIARAKLIEIISREVEEFIGAINKPKDCLTPIVIAKISDEERIKIQIVLFCSFVIL